MGCSGSKTKGEEGSIPAKSNPNGKTVSITSEVCSSWGYAARAKSVMDLVVAKLAERGYNVNYKVIAMPGGKGQFEVAYDKSGEKKVIFSNNQKLKQEGVVVGIKISDANVEDILKLIEV
jgi:hypothetical protein